MADDRFVPKSAGRVLGTLALVGALAGGATLLIWGCTNNDGGSMFKEPNRPFDAAAVDATGSGNTGDAGDAGTDAGKKDGATDGLLSHPDAHLDAHLDVSVDL
jgi:hypothetical protein